jgi:hypothetical protein
MPYLFRIPSAVIPLVMSGVALATVVTHELFSSSAPTSDEGAAAHVFQLMFAGQAPVVAFFAMKWLPREPSWALFVMALQAAAALVALTPVVIFDL